MRPAASSPRMVVCVETLGWREVLVVRGSEADSTPRVLGTYITQDPPQTTPRAHPGNERRKLGEGSTRSTYRMPKACGRCMETEEGRNE